MCILYPSLYSCAHTSAISSLLKARALQHEVDVQSHLSSCVLQLEKLKVVFQISKLFRCQIFIAAQHMASWLLVVFCFFFPFRLQSQTTGSWSCFKFFLMLLHILVPSVRLCTHFMYLLLYVAGGWHFVLTDQQSQCYQLCDQLNSPKTGPSEFPRGQQEHFHQD